MMLSSGRKRRRFLAYATLSALFVGLAACSSSESRDRNVQAVVGTPCKPAGQTKKFAKVTHVCGSTPTGTVWFTSVKSKAKAVNCTKLGAVRLKGKNTQVCGRDGKKKVWVLAAPLPPSMVAAASTVPLGSSTTVVTGSDSGDPAATTVPVAAPTDSATTAGPVGEAAIPAREVDPATLAKAAITEAPAMMVRFVAKPTKSRNGVDLAPRIVVQLSKQDGSAKAAEGVEVRLLSATAGVDVIGGSAKTSADGSATFTNTRLMGAPGRVELVAAADGLESATAVVDHAAGDPMRLEFVSRPTTMIAGEIWGDRLAVRLVDVAGHPVRRGGVKAVLRVVTAGSAPKEIENAQTDTEGVAQFTSSVLEEAGTTTLDVRPEDESIQTASFDVEVAPADAASVVVLTAIPDDASAGVAVAESVEVGVVDKFGNRIKGQGRTVVAAVAGAEANSRVSVFPAGVNTDAAGVARFTKLTIGGEAGNVSLAFAVRGEVLRSFEKEITLGHGPADGIRLAVEPSGTRSGEDFDVDPQIEVIDEYGNRVPTASGEVELVVADVRFLDGANLSATFDETGVAKFEGVKLRGKTGTYETTFVHGDFRLASTILLGHGSLASLEFRDFPASVTANERFTGKIALLDADRNLVTSSGIAVELTVELSSNIIERAGYTTGTTGYVSVDLQASKIARDYTLRAAVIGVSGQRSMEATQPLSVVASDADYVGSTEVPIRQALASGVVPARTPRLQIYDALKNVVKKSGVTMTITVTEGVGSSSAYTVSGGTATTDSSGTALFPDFSISGPAGYITVTFASDLAGVRPLEWPATLGPGPAAGLKLVREAAGLRSGIVATVQPILQVVDASGNSVKASGVAVSAARTASNGYGIVGATTTDANGTATFTNVKATGTAGANREIEYTANGLQSSKGNFTLEAGLPSSMQVGFEPWAVLDSGRAVGSVTVLDADKNVVPLGNYAVTLAASAPAFGAVWVNAPSPLVVANDKLEGSNIRLYGTRMTTGEFSAVVQDSSTRHQFSVPFRLNRGTSMGDPGPSGGRIVAVFPSPVSGVTGISNGGSLMESSPTALATTYATDSPSLSRSGITTYNFTGAGLANTAAIVGLNRSIVYAAAAAAGATISGKSDWFLGSRDETVGVLARASELFPGVQTPIVLTSSLVAPESVAVIVVGGSDAMSVKTAGYVVPVRLFG